MNENAFNKPDPDLKPCPFCGNADVFFLKGISGASTIMCSTSGCVEMVGQSRKDRLQDLADRWNTRMEFEEVA